MTEPAPPDVSVVLPCYNERDHVEQEIKRIRASLESAGMTYELICVDDGSTDGTREVLKQIPDVRLILFNRNQGSGTARRIGTQEATGRVVVWTDADMTYPNDLIPDLVRELNDDYDQVVGARKSEAGTYKFFRVPAKWAIRRVLRMVMYFNPLRVLMPVGLTLFGATFVKLVWDLVVHHFRVTGSTVLIGTAGFNIIAIGLLADLVVKRTATD